MSVNPTYSFSIHPDVLNFFPGGLTLTMGASTGGWECIKSLHNDSDSPHHLVLQGHLARWAMPSSRCPALSTTGAFPLRCPSRPESSPSSSPSSSSPLRPSTVGEASARSSTGMKPKKKRSHSR
ncbi:EGF-like module-containing mucin-like hormone receptor-like 2 [Platysternon megacephalum]|uniref:EGF-like module-containing mucin-like hormone receptor-like 2 n=1 Tax=Platysternon megacephalum TaxID=55544 RepID=A0A4D9DMY8_9SAUR|nr:EGF-like module-containing mucin-like hormone receptor-like 2 [Platysternon megacephalum]